MWCVVRGCLYRRLRRYKQYKLVKAYFQDLFRVGKHERKNSGTGAGTGVGTGAGTGTGTGAEFTNTVRSYSSLIQCALTIRQIF